MYRFALLFVLMAWVAPAWATVITTGDVDPGGAATQPDPWNVGGNLEVGNYGDGTLNVTDGGMVSNTYGYIGVESGSTGEVTVTGAGSRWNNSSHLLVGKNGHGTLNITDGGTVQVEWDTRVAWQPDSVGTIRLESGGTLDTGSLLSSFDNLKGEGTINTHGLVSDVELVFNSQESLDQTWADIGDDENITLHLNLTVDETGSLGAGPPPDLPAQYCTASQERRRRIVHLVCCTQRCRSRRYS